MRYLVLAVGKPKLAYAAAGVDEYVRRFGGSQRLNCDFIRPSNAEQEAIQLIEKSTGCFRVVLDEQGKAFSSIEFAKILQQHELHGISSIAFLIAGANGHLASTRRKADLLWSLSKATLPHELALVVVLEQLYRAKSILSGHPYHRP